MAKSQNFVQQLQAKTGYRNRISYRRGSEAVEIFQSDCRILDVYTEFCSGQVCYFYV